MRWRVLKAFDDTWSIIEDKMKEDRTASPTEMVKKSMNIRNFDDRFLEWVESNVRRLGVELSHVVRKEANVLTPFLSTSPNGKDWIGSCALLEIVVSRYWRWC